MSAILYAKFSVETRDFVSYLNTSEIETGPPVDPDHIYKALLVRYDHKNMMLDENGEAVERLTFPEFDKTTFIADGEDEAVVTGLPEGTEIYVVGPAGELEVVVDDGSFELSADIPGKIFVSLDATNYKYLELELTAT